MAPHATQPGEAQYDNVSSYPEIRAMMGEEGHFLYGDQESQCLLGPYAGEGPQEPRTTFQELR